MFTTVMNQVKCLDKRPLFCYGAGRVGQQFAQLCPLLCIRPDFYVDKNPKLWGQAVSLGDGGEARIISPDEMMRYEADCPVILTTTWQFHWAALDLKRMGFQNIITLPQYDTFETRAILAENKKHMDEVRGRLADARSRETLDALLAFRETNDYSLIESVYDKDQYFPDGVVKLSEKEVFVDGGSFDGETVCDFVQRTNGNFSFVYAFEPAQEFAEDLRQKFSGYIRGNNMEVIHKALYDRAGTVTFNNELGMGSRIGDEGKAIVETARLDDCSLACPPSMIKLDIEGAEWEALRGMERCIARHRPKLAISIYHKFNDLWELPLFLMEKYPGYRYYMRHHTLYSYDTVLYAIP